MANILVVEDDFAVQSCMVRVLEAEGHRISAVSDGLEALGKIYSQSYDLAILSVVLPHVSGAGLLDAIRKRSPRTMVVMVSGQADRESTIESLSNGAYDYIKKPLKEGDLEKIVRNALEEGRLMRNSAYIYKDSRRQDKSSIKSGIRYAIFDSLLAGFSIYLAFLGQIQLFRALDQPLLMGHSEFIQMALGLTFCYAFWFVFHRNYRVDLPGSGRELASRIWKNITGAYLLFAALLFLTRNINFAGSKIAVGLGYILGFLLILTIRLIIIPGAITRFQREGRKDIIFVSSGKPAAGVTEQALHQDMPGIRHGHIGRDHTVGKGIPPNAIVITSREDADRLVLTDDIEELYIAGDALSAVEVMNLLDRFRGRKLKVVLMSRTDDVLQRARIPARI